MMFDLFVEMHDVWGLISCYMIIQSRQSLRFTFWEKNVKFGSFIIRFVYNPVNFPSFSKP